MYRAEIKSRKRRSGVRPVQPRQTRADNGKRIGHGGPRHGAGRKKGSQNFFSREVKEAVIEAANRLGEDGAGKDGMVGYMVHLGRFEKSIFGGLLRAVMGTQFSVERIEQPKEYRSVADILEELRQYGMESIAQQALPYYRGPEIELDAAEIGNDNNEDEE
jgi:hypothetical protein